MSTNTAPSPALLAANERLLALRTQLAARCQVSAPPPPPASLIALSLVDTLAGLPPHLGWESEAVTHSLRTKPKKPKTAEFSPPPDVTSPPLPWTAKGDTPAPSLILYPDLALALLREEHTADGRLWLLLRHLDKQGKGWVGLDEAKAAVTQPASPLRFCGERQFHNLLQQGKAFSGM